MIERDNTGFGLNIEKALKSHKVEPFLLTMYNLEANKVGYDPREHTVAIIVETNVTVTEFAGTLSRSENFVAIDTDFYSLPAIVDAPEVVRVDWCVPKHFKCY